MTPMRLKPAAPHSGVKHSTSKPLHSRVACEERSRQTVQTQIILLLKKQYDLGLLIPAQIIDILKLNIVYKRFVDSLLEIMTQNQVISKPVMISLSPIPEIFRAATVPRSI